MNTTIRLALLGAALTGAPAWGQAPPAVQPFAAAADARQLADDEKRVWSEAGDYEKALRLRGELYGDATLDAYLQGIVDRLFPEFAGTLRIRLARSAQLNAFALPNGGLYLNLGLLARMENEAQLAAVLAHEGSHFVHRHGFQQRQNVKSSSALALVLGVAGGGLGSLVGNFAALASIYGYSKDLEREADRMGAARLARAGYALKEGVRVFEILDAEAKVLEVKEPFMFSSHPRLQERIDSFNELARETADGRRDSEEFQARVLPVRLAWMEAELALAQHKSLIHVLSQEGAAARYTPRAGYYLGEAYLLRGGEGDGERAETALRQAIEALPEFAPSYRALGIALMKRQQYGEARRLFERYLALAPAAADAAYVKDYLQQVTDLENQKAAQ